MSGRSRMAALTLVAGLGALSPLTPIRADDRPAAKVEPSDAPKSTPASTKPAAAVTLDLHIAGLGANGCEVEIKPAHAGCSFKPVASHVKSHGEAKVLINDVRTDSADRDCSFTITIREPGQPARTMVRGLRLNRPGAQTPQMLNCFLSSPSRVARMAREAGTTTKR